MSKRTTTGGGVATTVGGARARANSRSIHQGAAASLAPRSPRKRPSQGRSQHTVEVIVEAATRVFDQEGLQATTNRIAELAGVSIGSLYQYFPDKLALITELHERHCALVGQSVLSALDASESLPLGDVVRRVVAGSLSVHRDRPGLQRVLHAQLPQLREPDEASPAKRAMCERIRQLLEACLPATDPLTLTLAVRTLLTLAESLVHDAVLSPLSDVDDISTADNITQVVCGYIDRLASPE